MRCAVEMAPQHAAGLNLNTPERVLPLRTAALGSLRDVPREVPDPRARNRKFTRSSLLPWIAMGLLAGREIRNHGMHDVQREEHKTRSVNRAPNATPAILRVALIRSNTARESPSPGPGSSSNARTPPPPPVDGGPPIFTVAI
jgi:hypothetical protein